MQRYRRDWVTSGSGRCPPKPTRLTHLGHSPPTYAVTHKPTHVWLCDTMGCLAWGYPCRDNGAGIFVGNSGAPSAAAKMSIDNASASGNSDGVTATATANVLLGRSVITGNDTGIFNGTSPNTFYTYKDNRINLNTVVDIQTSGGSSALNTSLSQQ
jgi:hypothetical protein